jgi:hypothetical protein
MEDLTGVGAIAIDGIEVDTGFTKIPANRTLFVTSLQEEGPFEADDMTVPKEFSGSLKSLFAYAQPKVRLNLEVGDDTNSEVEEEIAFGDLSSFRIDKITERVDALNKLDQREKSIQKLMDEVNRNKMLQKVLADPAKRQSLLAFLQNVSQEIEVAELEQ